MAHFQSTIETPSPLQKLWATLQAFGGLLIRLSEANVRVRELERLSAMSNAELKRFGVARKDIVRHVYIGAL
jgi:5-enolpyruvylshikimate-3-phosphate synthase